MKLPSVLNIFMNLGVIVRAGKNIEECVQLLIKKQKVPKEVWFHIIDSLEEILSSGLINLGSELNPKDVNAVLEELKATFAYYPNGQKNLNVASSLTYQRLLPFVENQPSQEA